MMIRNSSSEQVTIANGAAVSNAFNMGSVAGGIILMPAAWTAASIGFQVSDEEGGTYYPLYDADGNIVEISSPAVDNGYSIPADVFGAAWVKLWSQDGSANDTNQGAARTLKIIKKS